MSLHNAAGHFCTITKHKLMVMGNCFRVGLYRQGLLHDLSKYSWEEFKTGVKYYQGTRSPNAAEKDDIGYSAAWLHHKGRNKHHFEYWIDYQIKIRRPGPVRMPARYLIEMFCDRVAASKVYQGENYSQEKPLEYLRSGHAKTLMHPETARVLEEWLEMLAEKGEDATFSHIRSLHRHVYR